MRSSGSLKDRALIQSLSHLKKALTVQTLESFPLSFAELQRRVARTLIELSKVASLPKPFLRDAAAAIGTCVIALLVLAAFSSSHVNIGEFGLFGIPAFGVLYALYQLGQNDQLPKRRKFKLGTKKPSDEIVWLRKRVVELQDQLSHGNAGPSKS